MSPKVSPETSDWNSPAIAEGKTAGARRNGAAERGVGGPGKSRMAGRKV